MKKSLWIKRICSIMGAIVLTVALGACFDSQPTIPVSTVTPPNVETPYYSLTSVNGEAYLVMENTDMEENEENNEDGLGGVIPLPILEFSSIAEMREKFLTGDFTAEELDKIKAQMKDAGKLDETSKLKIPNLNQLMDFDWSYGNAVSVSMFGEEYEFTFNGKNVSRGYLEVLSESKWREKLEREFSSVTETSDSKTVEVSRIQDRNAEEYILSVGENTRFYRKIKYLVYTQTTPYGKYVILERFTLVHYRDSCSDTVPESYTIFFQSNDGQFACVALYAPKERLSLEELCSIQLKPLEVSLSDAEIFR